MRWNVSYEFCSGNDKDVDARSLYSLVIPRLSPWCNGKESDGSIAVAVRGRFPTVAVCFRFKVGSWRLIVKMANTGTDFRSVPLLFLPFLASVTMFHTHQSPKSCRIGPIFSGVQVDPV
jgi:hypothetical protein